MMIILSSFHSRSLSSAMSAMQNLSLHVGLWQAASGMLERSWRKGLDVIVAAWSPDDRLLAFSGDDGVVRIVDTAGVEQVRYCGHSDIVWTMAFSPDARYMASAGYDRSVHDWEVDSGEILYVFGGHSGWVNSVAWSPDGTRIASGDGERVIVVHAFAGNDERRAGVEV